MKTHDFATVCREIMYIRSERYCTKLLCMSSADCEVDCSSKFEDFNQKYAAWYIKARRLSSGLQNFYAGKTRKK